MRGEQKKAHGHARGAPGRRERAVLGCLIFVCGLLFFPAAVLRAAEQDEVEFKNLRVKNLLDEIETKRRHRRKKVRARLGVFTGYETNAKLSAHRKGDFFEGLSLAVDYPKKLSQTLALNLDYDLFAHNYHELTDYRYILNQVVGRLEKRMGRFLLSGGSSALFLNYPVNREGDFWAPKGFIELRHILSKKLYHLFTCDVSAKNYVHAKALGDTSGSDQEKERRDSLYTVGYQIGGLAGKNFSWRLGTKLTVNDSNARYMDYYDYKSFRHSLNLAYKLSKEDAVFSSLSFTRKEYDARTISGGDPRQFNNLYSATCGLRHRLDAHMSLALYYTYRENVSNDAPSEYSDSVTTLSCQYYF